MYVDLNFAREAAWQLWPQLTLFAAVLVFFHASEFLLAAVFMREGLSCDSFLVSRPYAIAMLGALAEFAVEACFAPAWKLQPRISATGMLLVVLGEVLRKCAMVTAGGNFTHIIRNQQDVRHNLVTHGVYRVFRHPGYLGWYCWVIGTQLLLVNPISLIVFAYVSWNFFKERIDYEERLLVRFFGQQYVDYAHKTPTWLPGIPGIR